MMKVSRPLRPKRVRKSGPRVASAGKDKPKSGKSGVTDSIRSIAGQMMGLAGAAVDASIGVGGLLLGDPGQRKALARAGRLLRDVREKAGMTLADVGQAVDLNDSALLELAEKGKTALPFEVILRLAAVLARNDPVPFVMRLANVYTPGVGRTLEMLGVGRLVEHARREHDFVTIYRSRDAARRLTDADFAHVLKFVEAALDLALQFVDVKPSTSRRPRKNGGAARG